MVPLKNCRSYPRIFLKISYTETKYLIISNQFLGSNNSAFY